MLTNAAITIFNRYPDKEQKKFTYVPHILEDIWFHTAQKATVSDGKLDSADEYKIRVPFPRDGWVPPERYRNLEKLENHWTVQKEDFFILGVWEHGEVSNVSEIKKKFSGVVGTVLNYSENFFGNSPHIRVGGGS